MSDDHESLVRAILVGESRVIRQVRREIGQFARTRLPVLLQGPTGSGKELAARAIHLVSRRTGSLVAFNVCALGDGMFEDALFGHARGAFTGAVRDSAGFLAEANGGSVFLDEISGLTLSAQAKLLRALETGVFRPVGGSRDRTSDFRLIAASNESLPRQVQEGRFRADLYHRIGGCVIALPALCARRDDIPALLHHFLVRGEAPGVAMTQRALRRLQEHAWPGNVRELKHVVERLVAIAGGVTIDDEHVATALDAIVAEAPDAIDDAFADQVRTTLVETGWDIKCTAERLGVHPATVYRWVRRLGIGVPAGTRQRREALDAAGPVGAGRELRILP